MFVATPKSPISTPSKAGRTWRRNLFLRYRTFTIPLLNDSITDWMSKVRHRIGICSRVWEWWWLEVLCEWRPYACELQEGGGLFAWENSEGGFYAWDFWLTWFLCIDVEYIWSSHINWLDFLYRLSFYVLLPLSTSPFSPLAWRWPRLKGEGSDRELIIRIARGCYSGLPLYDEWRNVLSSIYTYATGWVLDYLLYVRTRWFLSDIAKSIRL